MDLKFYSKNNFAILFYRKTTVLSKYFGFFGDENVWESILHNTGLVLVYIAFIFTQ